MRLIRVGPMVLAAGLLAAAPAAAVRVGYYDAGIGAGVPAQVPPITVVGHTPVLLNDLSAADWAGIDVAFVQNSFASGYSAELLGRVADIAAAVSAGKILVFHDNTQPAASGILPGGAGFAFTSFFGQQIDVRDDSTLVTHGPAGTITDSTLDLGLTSGWATDTSLPASAHLILTTDDPSHVVTFSYRHGAGTVIYSSIPLAVIFAIDFPGDPNRLVYAPNVIAYAASLVAVCGNGVVEGAEGCDDSNLVDGDGCDSNCQPTGCPNGVVTTGEECDDGNAVDDDCCSNTCQSAACGDGTPQPGCSEGCDDGNLTDGDGCDSNCTPTGCGNAILTAGEQCDDGGTLPCDGCGPTCQLEGGCGDGLLAAICGEVCDDGNLMSGDGCDANCRPTGCGNGVVTLGEQCDDGGTAGCDGCSPACQTEVGLVCGDGVVNAACGEQCDDGDTTSGDGCDASCQTERCFACSGVAPSACAPITACANADLCCPGGCTLASDDDCAGLVPLGGEIAVNLPGERGIEGPDVAADAGGNFVVVWRGTNYGHVSAQRFDSAGVPQGERLQIGSFSDGGTVGSDLSVASSATGRFMVVWGPEASAVGGQDTDVLGRVFNKALPFTGSFFVNGETAEYQENPRVAADAAGDFVAVWNADYGEGPGCCAYGVIGRRFDSAGNAKGADFVVNTYTGGNEGDAASLDVASDAAGNFIVVWQAQGHPLDDYGIFGQRFDSAGVRRGGEFQVNTDTPAYQELPMVGADPAGNFMVAWRSYDATGDGIFARLFDSTGNPHGGEFQVNTYTTGFQGGGYYAGPAVAADPAGNFLVVWSSEHGGAYTGIFARMFDATGAPQGGEFQVNTSAAGPQSYPVAAALGERRFVVAWTDYGDDHVVARRLGILGPQDLRLPGKSLLIKNPPAGPEKNRGVWMVTDHGIVAGERETSEDPRCNGAPPGTVKATLRFASPTSGHGSDTIDLPCQNWSALGSQQAYRYADSELDDGPCKLVRLIGGHLIKAVCVGSGATTDFPYDLTVGTDEGIVDVVLTVGTIRYCTAFDDYNGKNGSDGRLFKGLDAPAPSACP